jgi:predicted acylesterase/phospholipase RssA
MRSSRTTAGAASIWAARVTSAGAWALCGKGVHRLARGALLGIAARQAGPDVRRRPARPAGDLTEEERARVRYRLRVIASDVSEGRMLVLPDDIEDYEDEDGRPLTRDTFPIARAVRMSMSFPYFFEPVTLRRNGEPHLIVDGGLLSNFPIFLFDGDKPPLRRWTFGFRLFSGAPPERPPYRRVPRPLWELPLAKAMFSRRPKPGTKSSPRQPSCAPSASPREPSRRWTSPSATAIGTCCAPPGMPPQNSSSARNGAT